MSWTIVMTCGVALWVVSRIAARVEEIRAAASRSELTIEVRNYRSLYDAVGSDAAELIRPTLATGKKRLFYRCVFFGRPSYDDTLVWSQTERTFVRNHYIVDDCLWSESADCDIRFVVTRLRTSKDVFRCAIVVRKGFGSPAHARELGTFPVRLLGTSNTGLEEAHDLSYVVPDNDVYMDAFGELVEYHSFGGATIHDGEILRFHSRVYAD